ncbi:YgfZ/GcvT domain-containing protein [Marinobacter sp. F4216]|uniref:CAF17-like 4Fe-4S cluster assembly/insertion protein YgfZ n=1 Tax=Marinobacter sp. F4216 TaxID=2874281 RepID=UPI001CC12C55|nr:folate-binding protein [Marinobacter sp. F4216]MBZ2167299.1 folate-binding protein [Marinobacter sp. F4216]
MTDTQAPVSPTTAQIPRPESGWAALTDRVIIRVSGTGTDPFLQGQFSQNLAEVVPGYSPRAAAANPKGRAYCLTRMVREGDDILLDLPAALADGTLAHLQKYLMLFRGTSASIESESRILGLFGTDAASVLAGDRLPELKAPGDTLEIKEGCLIRVEPTAEGLPRFELWCLTGAIEFANLQEHSLADWQATEVAAGVAILSPATQEEFVPQMLNWQHLGGVHFKKGCYTGQEVIARMHFLGQLKKSLFRFALNDAATAPTPGSALLAGDRSVGTVVNAIQYENGRCELLAVVRHDADVKALRAEDAPDHSLEPLPLPYAVTEQTPPARTDT